MRVVLNGPFAGDRPAGPGTHARSLTRALLDQGGDLELVVRHVSLRNRRSAGAAARSIHPRLRVRAVPMSERALRWTQSHVGQPSERALMGRYDVYHQLHADADPVAPGHRLVVTLHDTVALEWPEAEGAMAAAAGHLLRRSAAVITVSAYSKAAILHAFDIDAEKVVVIPNGVDHRRLNPQEAARAGPASRQWLGLAEPYVLYVGGGTPRKNVGRLIEAFGHVVRQAPDDRIHLVLAGPVRQQESRLRAGVEDPAVQDRLRFTGYVPDHLMAGVYGEAVVLACPSLYEGFGLPSLEAMACGTPVVAGRAGALPEVVGDAAVLVDPMESNDIAKALLETAFAAVADRARRRTAGLTRALPFDWGTAARRTMAVYEALAEGV